MRDKHLTLIGAGNMGGALVRGLRAADLIPPSQITVVDLDQRLLEAMKATHGVTATSEASEGVPPADIVLLAVKPFVLESVLDGLKDLLLGNEDLFDEFAMAFREEAARLRKQRRSAQGRLHRELAKVTQGIERCLEFITGGEGDPGSVRERLRTLEARKADIEIELRAPEVDDTVEPHPNLIELYRRKVSEL